MSSESYAEDKQALCDKISADPTDWESRRKLAHLLYDKQAFEEAADLIWQADPIPSNDIDLAFAARILAKARPRRAIRLLTAILEQNRGKAVQNLGMANALLHHGMVLQAARFYGAALEIDPTLANPDLEHFVLWTDDEQRLWGDFNDRRPALGDLPWMVRDEREAKLLHAQMSGHTTPVQIPKLPATPAEELRHEIYQQEARLNAKITPPPSVTIPIDRVDPKHRRIDNTYGAEVAEDKSSNQATPPTITPAPVAAPITAPVVSPAPRPAPIVRRPVNASATPLTPSPDAPPRKTTVMPIQFPPPTSAMATAGPAKKPPLPALPQVDPAAPKRNPLVFPAGLKPASPSDGEGE